MVELIDKLTVEIIKNASIYTSEEMGIALRNTAYSPNIRDRLDHTCAILSHKGELVAQAEHIPVHIGSMTVGVQGIMRYLSSRDEELLEGDIVMTNDPYLAGTHLNDVTLLKPIYYQGEVIAMVANKAHHVDIGGITPGSIGGGARELIQEGIIIPPIKIMRGGEINEEIIEIIKSNVRTPRYFEGDLKAQIAALNVGEKRILELARKYGGNTLKEAWMEILNYTEVYTRSKIGELGVKGEWIAEDYIEVDDREIILKVKLSINNNSIKVDFTGSSPQLDEPVNAVYGVTVAATSYALKAVIDPEMPVNQGFFRVVSIEAPPGTIVNPYRGAPVSGGNVETSQRIADVVFAALAKALPGKVPAASCGTMTNVMIGGRTNAGSWTFYETIACGQGARPSKDGVDGVHTNMTNTLNTPIERLETEYPVLFLAYELRENSEGPGRYRGGLGITRAFMLREGKATLTIMAERCKRKPWGLNGGREAEPSRHYIVRNNGERVELGCKKTVTINEGDMVYINTPGGGGYGNPCIRDREQVEQDIVEGKISRERAIKYYCYI